ncbi:hypothetical protein J2S97_004872 [Arthrobacter oryzae]|nr:SRPBCC family protein [Arthrobacter oryzae]MDQ0079663.1 hypothetical protein [Arthrobacter oryzae]
MPDTDRDEHGLTKAHIREYLGYALARYYAITIKPTVFVNLVPDHVIIHRMFPMAADHSIVECEWLYLPSVVESGKDGSASVELFHRVNQ